MSQKTVHLIAAARPNFMKIAPVFHALTAEDWCKPMIVHTGQHYDANMSDEILKDLRVPAPDFHLGIGSGSHAEQTAGVMVAYEKICIEAAPDLTIVVGDVNSTMACTIAAKKLNLKVAHLEAGLRSRDWEMPEEINRILTDSIADELWTPSPDADENLRAEGVAEERIVRVGNVMIDSYEMLRDIIEASATRTDFGLDAGSYAVVTMHRPSNVDALETLSVAVEGLIAAATMMPIVFPVHPRTRASLERHGLWARLSDAPNVHLAEPIPYIRFMGLVRDAGAVITDSGGLQEETTYLDIPCLTLRENTERPITIDQGTNRLVPLADLAASIETVKAGKWPSGSKPDLWDGKTADRIAAHLRDTL